MMLVKTKVQCGWPQSCAVIAVHITLSSNSQCKDLLHCIAEALIASSSVPDHSCSPPSVKPSQQQVCTYRLVQC